MEGPVKAGLFFDEKKTRPFYKGDGFFIYFREALARLKPVAPLSVSSTITSAIVCSPFPLSSAAIIASSFKAARLRLFLPSFHLWLRAGFLSSFHLWLWPGLLSSFELLRLPLAPVVIRSYFPAAAGVIVHIPPFKPVVILLHRRIPGGTVVAGFNIPVRPFCRPFHSSLHRLSVGIIVGPVESAAVIRTIIIINLRLPHIILPAETTVVLPAATGVIVLSSVKGAVIIHPVSRIWATVIVRIVTPEIIVAIVITAEVVIVPETTTVPVITFKLAGCNIPVIVPADIRPVHTHFIVPERRPAGCVGLAEANRVDPAAIDLSIIAAGARPEAIAVAIAEIVDDDRCLVNDRHILPPVNIVVIDPG